MPPGINPGRSPGPLREASCRNNGTPAVLSLGESLAGARSGTCAGRARIRPGPWTAQGTRFHSLHCEYVICPARGVGGASVSFSDNDETSETTSQRSPTTAAYLLMLSNTFGRLPRSAPTRGCCRRHIFVLTRHRPRVETALWVSDEAASLRARPARCADLSFVLSWWRACDYQHADPHANRDSGAAARV